MRFEPTPLQGAYTIELERHGDGRGFFARLFGEKEFAEAGLVSRFVQLGDSFNAAKGTLRGMHYRLQPSAEAKVVRCMRGALHDVIADLRPDSPTFRRSWAVELTADNRTMCYVPRGFAHGFVTLSDDTEVLYLLSDAHAPQDERGLRYDDPWLNIDWPMKPVEVSLKDQSWPMFTPDFHGVEKLRGL
ncbi:MAG: dTDP-4-dehydrorhamnose 3,5-epimerase [Pseudomonadota bacterium]